MGLFVVLLGIVAIIAAALYFIVKNLLYVCQPNEVLVFSGWTNRKSADGTPIGYRTIKGGRTLRKPFVETVDRIDLTNMIIEVAVRNAYSKGGIPLTVQGVANIKIPGEQPLIHNALERFLGRSRDDIMRIARETLEGNLRGVLATLTPEQVNRDKEAFAEQLKEEAEKDFGKIGLVLDTLNIQNVSDDVGYLDALGRMRSASIRRDAQIAEADAQAGAAEVKWANFAKGELAKIQASIDVARKDNERRIADARTQRGAMIAEQQAQVQAAIAQAQAEVGMQEARIEQVRLQLQADVLQPAEARRSEAVANAKADAAVQIEQGRATAKVLTDLAATYRASGTKGRDVLLMQKLIPVLNQIAGTMGEMKVDKLTVIGKSDGANGNNGGGSLAGQLISGNEQIKAATGIDVAGVFKSKLGDGAGSKDPRIEYNPPPRSFGAVDTGPAE